MFVQLMPETSPQELSGCVNSTGGGEFENLLQVIGLYTKSKSPLHTAAFYEVSAQADMDENRDYARAECSMQARHPQSTRMYRF